MSCKVPSKPKHFVICHRGHGSTTALSMKSCQVAAPSLHPRAPRGWFCLGWLFMGHCQPCCSLPSLLNLPCLPSHTHLVAQGHLILCRSQFHQTSQDEVWIHSPKPTEKKIPPTGSPPQFPSHHHCWDNTRRVTQPGSCPNCPHKSEMQQTHGLLVPPLLSAPQDPARALEKQIKTWLFKGGFAFPVP